MPAKAPGISCQGTWNKLPSRQEFVAFGREARHTLDAMVDDTPSIFVFLHFNHHHLQSAFSFSFSFFTLTRRFPMLRRLNIQQDHMKTYTTGPHENQSQAVSPNNGNSTVETPTDRGKRVKM